MTNSQLNIWMFFLASLRPLGSVSKRFLITFHAKFIPSRGLWRAYFGFLKKNNKKDLWNDFSGFPRIGIKIQRKDIMFPNNFFYKNCWKKNLGEKKFLDPLSEKTGARNGKKTLKMANFRPKKGKIWPKKWVILIFHNNSIKRQ